MTDYIRYNVLSYNSRVVTESFTVIHNHIHCLNRGLEYMGAILQTTFSNAFSELKSAELFIQISLKFVSEDPVGNTSAIVQVIVLRQTRILAFIEPDVPPLFTTIYWNRMEKTLVVIMLVIFQIPSHWNLSVMKFLHGFRTKPQHITVKHT